MSGSFWIDRNSQTGTAGARLAGWLAVVVAGAGCWWFLYASLDSFAAWTTYSLLGMTRGSRGGKSIEFFFYDAPKVMMLLVAVVFAVGVIRSFFTPARARRLLVGRRESLGNVLAALLGIVTPFCSCSAVPLFIGFVTAGVPLGVTLSFLISAPMVNEVALVLLFGLFGWKTAAIYLGMGLTLAVVAGWTIGRMGLEGSIEPWVYESVDPEGQESAPPIPWRERALMGWWSVREIVGRVWLYVLLGIAVGGLIHGYVPADFMASFMGSGAWWSVPLAVILGIPMYANAAGIIPVVEALLEKGASLGTVLSFMMSVIALSLPEMIILRKVLRPRLLATFIGVVGAGILLVGYLFNAVI